MNLMRTEDQTIYLVFRATRKPLTWNKKTYSLVSPTIIVYWISEYFTESLEPTSGNENTQQIEPYSEVR